MPHLVFQWGCASIYFFFFSKEQGKGKSSNLWLSRGSFTWQLAQVTHPVSGWVLNQKNKVFLHPISIITLPLLSSTSIPGPSSALLGEQQGKNLEISFLSKPWGLLFPISLHETLRDVYLTINWSIRGLGDLQRAKLDSRQPRQKIRSGPASWNFKLQLKVTFPTGMQRM